LTEAEDVAAPEAREIEEGDALVLDLGAFEGPLHVLLELARAQKVDLARLSISALADQYLAFIANARAREMDLAADYLVMAAWLAYLKSRLLLPKPQSQKEEPAPEELAAQLRRRLENLQVARAVAARLWEMPQIDRDVFLRGQKQAIALVREPVWEASLHDLLKAYAARRLKAHRSTHAVKPRPAYPIEEARKRLEIMLERQLDEWRPLQSLTPRARGGEHAPPPSSYVASLLSAALELVRDGRLDIRQSAAFEPLLLKARAP